MNGNTVEHESSAVVLAFAAGIFALLFWSGSAIANKIAVVSMDGFTVGVLRSILAGGLSLVIIVIVKCRFPRAARDRWLLVLSGLTSFAVWPVLMSLGIERTSAGHAALIMALIPVFTVFIASTVVQRKHPPMGWWLGAAIAFCATMVLLVAQGRLEVAGPGSRNDMNGDLLVLAGGMVCAVGYVAGAKVAPSIGALATTFWGLAIASMIQLPLFFYLASGIAWGELSTNTWLAIAWLAFLSSLVGYILWFFALSRGGIARIGTMQLAMPVVTLLLATVVLQEPLGFFIVLVAATIVAGTFLAQRNV